MRTNKYGFWLRTIKRKNAIKMEGKIIKGTAILLVIFFNSCSGQAIKFSPENIKTVNRDLIRTDNENVLELNSKKGGGMAVLRDIHFDYGTIEIALKGENNPGKSFIGIAFNIQNDSTYEAIYFRPFNFRSDDKNRREHSVQYISEPKNSWEALRTNHEGQYESEYINPPSPNDWFTIKIEISKEKVSVFDKASNTELLAVKRLEEQMFNKMAFWVGNNSKGAFKNLILWN